MKPIQMQNVDINNKCFFTLFWIHSNIHWRFSMKSISILAAKILAQSNRNDARMSVVYSKKSAIQFDPQSKKIKQNVITAWWAGKKRKRKYLQIGMHNACSLALDNGVYINTHTKILSMNETKFGISSEFFIHFHLDLYHFIECRVFAKFIVAIDSIPISFEHTFIDIWFFLYYASCSSLIII